MSRGLGDVYMRQVVYFPMFYKNGTLMPAAPAFVLTPDGGCEKLACKEKKMQVTARNYTAYLFPEEIAEAKETLVGAYLVGRNDLDSPVADTLYRMTDCMDAWENDILLDNQQAYRYIQLVAPKDSVALCEISFFESEKEDKPIGKVGVSAGITPLSDGEQLGMLADHCSATGFKGVFNNPKKRVVCFDLGKPCPIRKISYIPYTRNYLYKDKDIDLCYWDNRWVSTGIRKGDGKDMTFDHIPEGTIYRVRVKGTNDRIFTYKNGIIRWY